VCFLNNKRNMNFETSFAVDDCRFWSVIRRIQYMTIRV
jgi:hypothetical protein